MLTAGKEAAWMGKPYSSDLRQRFVAALDEGMSASAAGRRMRIARATAVRWAAT
ncbi:IS630 transposase-related protein, partial [Rhodovulum sp.]|uniref:IS630 transposase-related protein n=1 Tax=Rhodovulum sp. TaxID=34009 RepID=UPI001842861F|nr:IS630 family transposase [Rhodovulum sp.]